MATTKYICPNPAPVGSGTFSDDLVGFQLVSGGGLTQGNFEFTTSIYEKVNRTFDTGVFSDPYTLETLNIESIAETKQIIKKNFQVYPNFDLSQITSFSLYGSLQKRMSASITKIINYFPAAIQIDSQTYGLTTGYTAYNIVYDPIENETSFEVNVEFFKNPFGIDYSVNATQNLKTRTTKVSDYRNMTSKFLEYALYVGDYNNQFDIVDFDPTQTLSAGTIPIVVKGKPFTSTTTTDSILLKPNNLTTEKIFQDAFDEVEDYLLNRNGFPKYTVSFKYPDYDSNGNYILINRIVTWKLDGLWNLDISTDNFDKYLESIQYIAERLDEFKTNLISRFLTSGSLKEFDTGDQKVEKVLQIYGRSFDETKKFIDALSNINSVNYIVGNDIPSQLLSNLSKTLGWNSGVSPITNDGLLESIFTTTNDVIYPGQSKEQTPAELNYQYYRNLILNSAFLFKSKGTRKSIEYILRMVGAPEALIEFNEYVYLADQKISLDEFDTQYATISGGTKYVTKPVYLSNNVFSIWGVQYSGYSTSGVMVRNNLTINDFPIDTETGYPQTPTYTDDYFFQKGAGWFEVTPQHRSPEKFSYTKSDLNSQIPVIKSVLEPFTYGQEYLDRYNNFPYLDLGYNLTRTIDNKKSWKSNDIGLRKSTDPISSTNYDVEDDRLVLNVKNMELYLNMGQGITYDIWYMSANYGYPIPNSGLTAPYPSPGDVDWTYIDPKPNQKTFFEFAQSFYNNFINVRNRQWISDGKTGGYPTLQSIFWKYINTNQTLNIPNNEFTYQKMIDFTLSLGDYWIRLVEQFVPATTLWNTGQKMDNSAFHRQKFVWRRQRGCTFTPLNVPCFPCTYNGEPYTYDCIDQTTQCTLTIFDPIDVLNTQALTLTGVGPSCNFNSMVSNWYVNLKLIDMITNQEDTLISELFYTGYGQSAEDPISGIPLTYYDVINAIDNKLQYLYQYGLNYYFTGGVLTISNSTCYDDFTNKRLNLSIGLDINIVC
jgi:hypothetical protein